MSIRRLTLASLLSLGVTVGTLALVSAPALAVLGHPLLAQFNVAGEGIDGMTVGPAGDLYLAERKPGESVERLSSAGAPVDFSASESYIEGPNLTGTPNGPFGDVEGVAVDNATGEIYVAEEEARAVDVFSASGEYRTQLKGFNHPAALAFDQSTGDLYVLDGGAGRVDVFNSSGKSVTTIGEGLFNPGTAGTGTIAVSDLTGTLYVGNYRVSGEPGKETYENIVTVFDAAGDLIPPEWSGLLTPSGSLSSGIASLATDQSSGHVYFDNNRPGSAVYEFGSSTSEEYLDQSDRHAE